MAPAPVAITSGTSPKMKAKLVIITGRKRKLARLDRRRRDIFTEFALLDRKCDDQNAVLGGERDQDHQFDLGIDVEA